MGIQRGNCIWYLLFRLDSKGMQCGMHQRQQRQRGQRLYWLRLPYGYAYVLAPPAVRMCLYGDMD
jgi:hypothetical protein